MNLSAQEEVAVHESPNESAFVILIPVSKIVEEAKGKHLK